MGDEDKEVTEEDMDKANEKKREAISAFSEQEFEKAVQLYTEAILLNPGN
jgi:suppressor of tumorigenicity protein 13